jgi:hypothetical protein
MYIGFPDPDFNGCLLTGGCTCETAHACGIAFNAQR